LLKKFIKSEGNPKGERHSRKVYMSKIVLNAETRTVIGKQVKQLRREGKLPAVIYGHKFDPQPITLDLRETTKAMLGSTASSLLTINLNGKELSVIVREKQKNFIRNEYIHLDFLAVSLTEKLRTTVAVVLEGESLAVKDFDAVLVTGLTEVEVEAYPQDLPEKFFIDVAPLKKPGDSIAVKDITVSDKVEILTDPEEMLVLAAGRSGDAAEEAAEDLAAAEPEVVEKGKKDDNFED